MRFIAWKAPCRGVVFMFALSGPLLRGAESASPILLNGWLRHAFPDHASRWDVGVDFRGRHDLKENAGTAANGGVVDADWFYVAARLRF